MVDHGYEASAVWKKSFVFFLITRVFYRVFEDSENRWKGIIFGFHLLF